MSSSWRKNLTPDDYAVPGKEKMPIRNTPDDVSHTKLAWDMVDRTKGLSDAERSEARRRILHRAKELGIDTSNWKLTASIRFEAVALDMPNVEDHPNRMPFTGVLVMVDEASDLPPGGSGGHQTFIPSAIAEAALDSLLGMAVDFKPNFDGHDSRRKIGLITEATVMDNELRIGGFFYAKDFPAECDRIKAEKDRLGFSYECQARIQDPEADLWVFEHCVFTGAAVLYKDKAAYQSTSLAAQAETDTETLMDPELKKLLEALGAKLDAVTTDVTSLKANADKSNIEANAVVDKVKPHSERLRAAADKMEADGIGTHRTRGHANVLRHMAASMDAEALHGELPHIYRDHDFIDHHLESSADKGNKADPAVTKKMETLEAAIGELGTVLKDIQAKAFTNAAQPERKTISPEIKTLLAKGGVDTEGDVALTASQADEMLTKMGVTGSDRIAKKLLLKNAGVLKAA